MPGVRIPVRRLSRLGAGLVATVLTAGVVSAQTPVAPAPAAPAPAAEAPAAPKAPAPGETPTSPATPVSEAAGELAPPPSARPTTPAKPATPLPRSRYDVAVLQALDKVTAETLRFEAKVGVPVRWKGLIFTVRACERTAADEPVTDSIAYLTVDAQPRPQPGRLTPPPKQAFKGWMYASSPALNPMQHATYDAWVISCRASAPSPVAAPAARPSPKPAPTEAEPPKLDLPPAAPLPAAKVEPPPVKPAA